MYNRSTIFQQSLPKPSWPGSHYLESLQELPALHVCIHTHISTQTWINMLMTGFSLIWDLVEMFLSGKCSVSARQLVKCPLDYCISSSQTCTEGSCRNVLHAICSVYSRNHTVIAFVCVFTYVCGFFSFTLRLCEPVGCHTDAHKYVFTYVTLQRRYEILTYSPLELMDSTNWWGHCSYIHTLPLTCTIGICNSSKPSHIL